MSASPLEQLLGAIDRRDVDAAMALSAPDVRLLTVDGRRAEGREAVRKLMTDFLSVLRSLSHPNANHVQASLSAMTGHAHPIEEEKKGDFPPSPTDFPPAHKAEDALPRTSTESGQI